MTALNTPQLAPQTTSSRGAGIFAHRGFLAAVIVLALAAVGLNASVQFLQLHFKREAVPMRKTFTAALPEIITDPTTGDQWVQLARDENLNPDVLHSLATNEFLFCDYVNAKAAGMTPKQLKEAAGSTFREQQIKSFELSQRFPEAVIKVGLTYYTGKADTVAHIPERCYVGDGFEPVNPQTENWAIANHGNLDVRVIRFENQARRTRVPVNVAYFFQTNGRYEADSLAVRATLQDLFAKYGYYAKVELRCDSENRTAAEDAIRRFLTASLPDVKAALPDWSQYQGKK